VAFTFHHITLNVSDLTRSRAFYEGVLVPPVPGTPDGDRFSERRIGLDPPAIGVPVGEVARLAEVLTAAGVPNSGVKADPLGPTMITFRDPDNVQWEFFEET
jgi:glyoxylase I family protein